MTRIGLLSDTHNYLDDKIFFIILRTVMKYGMPAILAVLLLRMH